jgi:DNA-binding SARP family transcriptional activator
MTSTEFRILGPLTVCRADGRPAALGGRKPRTLLAALLLARGRVVPDERLISLVWDGVRPGTVDAQLRTYASRLRRVLPARLVRTGGGYLLESAGRVDAEEFERLASVGDAALRTGDAARAARLFRVALGLWRGPVLADVAESLREGEAARFDELRLAALEGRIEADVAAGDHLSAVPDVTGLVHDHPLRERAWELLMTALCASGRPADAVAAYHRGRRILDERLGIAPGPALRAAYERLLQPIPGG